MKKKIALVSGGFQNEAVVSYKSAEQVAQALDKTKYRVYNVHVTPVKWTVVEDENEFEIDKSDFSFSRKEEKIKFDYAFIMIHGSPGEDGKLQAYFDLIKLPYSTGSFFNMALTFNKNACKAMLRNHSVKMAKDLILIKGKTYDESHIVNELKLPVFVKPCEAGSSFGISKVKCIEELKPAIEKAFEEDEEIILEEFIDGTEVTCGVLKTKSNTYLLPLTEIVSKNEFFDYEAKYTTGMADEITPARISLENTKAIHQISEKIYDALHCKGIVRIDYIIKNNEAYFIEVNTVPGMSKNSIVPQMAAYAGLKLKDLFTEIIEE